MFKRTTDLEQLEHGAPFTWGEIVTLHKIGPYTIAEYKCWQRVDCLIKRGIVSDKTLFHIWIDGRDCGQSWPTLDSAIVAAIAYRAEGPNSQAAHYFMRMVADN